VTERRDGVALERPAVVVASDGTFTVPYVGDGRYELGPALGFVDVPAQAASGGDWVAIEGGVARPYVEAVPSIPPRRRAEWTVDVRSLPDGSDGKVPYGVLAEDDRVFVALPRPGRYRLALSIPGDDAGPPLDGGADVEVSSDPVRIDVLFSAAPHGTVVVRATDVGESVRGAHVSLDGGRERSLFPAISPEARFAHVRAGPVVARVRWSGDERAIELVAGDVAAGETLLLSVRPAPGGRVRVRPPADAGDGSWRLSWEADGAPYGVAGAVDLVESREHGGWVTENPLRPGRYRAHVAREGARETATVEFEIRAGEVTEGTPADGAATDG
jgi:hypothetical protein